MDRKLILGALLSLSFLATGCSNSDSSTSSTSTTDSSSASTSIVSSETTDTSSSSGYDFTTSLTSNGVSADEDSYVISTISEDHINYASSNSFKASITFSCDSSWSLVTALNSNYTVLTSEDQTIIPDDAMELSTILDTDINGSNGTNEIVGLRIRIDRSMISAGTTNVLLQVRPNNGSSSISSVTANLCVPVTVGEYGTIEVDTYTTTLNLDLSNLDSKVSSKLGSSTPTTLTFYFYDNEAVYGANETYTISYDLLEFKDDSLSFSKIKYPIGHTFMVYIYVSDGSNAYSLAFSSSETSSSYEYTIANNTTYLEILENNASVNLKLE